MTSKVFVFLASVHTRIRLTIRTPHTHPHTQQEQGTSWIKIKSMNLGAEEIVQ